PAGVSGLTESAATAKTPVSSVPVAPPMPCTPNTSRESSEPQRSLSQVHAKKHMAPEMSPMMMPCHGSTNPEAGVIVPSPATAPEIMPSHDGSPCVPHFRDIQGYG